MASSAISRCFSFAWRW